MGVNESYSSAGVLPAKLLSTKEVCVDHRGNIAPVHIQICPTNRCNLDCPFCSCAGREKGQELGFESMISAIDFFKAAGAESITITGGGEPCLYPHITDMIARLYDIKIGVGLVSNGLLLQRAIDVLPKVTWCRVSVSDHRDIDKLFSVMRGIVPSSDVDWAFSYVLTDKWEFTKFIRCLEFANEHSFTHVRLVADIMNTGGVTPMQTIKENVRAAGVNDSKVIYQDRKHPVRGSTECRISLLKPMLAPDGYIYPCCGVQYALDGSLGVWPENMRLCHMSELPRLYATQHCFDGSICDRCYYDDYNKALSLMVKRMDHEAWV